MIGALCARRGRAAGSRGRPVTTAKVRCGPHVPQRTDERHCRVLMAILVTSICLVCGIAVAVAASHWPRYERTLELVAGLLLVVGLMSLGAGLAVHR